jgi:hypothetical protein
MATVSTNGLMAACIWASGCAASNTV